MWYQRTNANVSLEFDAHRYSYNDKSKVTEVSCKQLPEIDLNELWPQ